MESSTDLLAVRVLSLPPGGSLAFFGFNALDACLFLPSIGSRVVPSLFSLELFTKMLVAVCIEKGRACIVFAIEKSTLEEWSSTRLTPFALSYLLTL